MIKLELIEFKFGNISGSCASEIPEIYETIEQMNLLKYLSLKGSKFEDYYFILGFDRKEVDKIGYDIVERT